MIILSSFRWGVAKQQHRIARDREPLAYPEARVRHARSTHLRVPIEFLFHALPPYEAADRAGRTVISAATVVTSGAGRPRVLCVVTDRSPRS